MEAAIRKRRTGESKKARYDANILPQDLMVEILLRLPAKSVARFRCVCKSWNSTTSDPSFVDEHHSRRAAIHKSMIVLKKPHVGSLKISSHDNEGDFFHLFSIPDLKYSESCSSNSVVLKKPRTYMDSLRISSHDFEGNFIDLFTIPDLEYRESCLSNAVNGLIFLCGRNTAYLLNPMTQESVMLPKRGSPSKVRTVKTVGLGLSNYTRQYKVVRQLSLGFESTPVWEILTVGTDEWRSIKQFPAWFHYGKSLWPPVFLHGALHWTFESIETKDVITFDMESETFGCFECPATLCLMGLIQLDAHLGAVSMSPTGGWLSGAVEIWKLEDYANKIWSKEYTLYVEEDLFPHVTMGFHDGKFLVRKMERGGLVSYMYKINGHLFVQQGFDKFFFLYTESLVSPKMLLIVEKNNISYLAPHK